MSNNESLRPGSLGGLKVKKANESKENSTTLIYGAGGVGKTTLAASIADVERFGPVLHINVENGAGSIASRSNIDLVDVDSILELQAVFSELHSKNGAGYGTIIVDNLTEAQAQGFDHILKTAKSRDFVDFEGATFSNGAWNRSSEQMRKLVRYFRDLPVYTIFVAWEKDYSDGGIPDIGPAFTKTFGQEMPGLVNDVFRMSIKNGERILQTSRTDRAAAKDRTGLLPPIIKNPTMSLLNDYWTGVQVKPSEAEAAAANKAGGSILASKKRN